MQKISPMPTYTLEKIEQYQEFCKFLERHLNIVCNTNAVFSAKCGVLEAVNNAIEHGKFPVYIEFKSSDHDEFVIKITDSGQGFLVNEKIQLIKTKGADQMLEERLYEERGRGLFIMFKTLSKVLFNDKGNEVSLFIPNTKVEFSKLF